MNYLYGFMCLLLPFTLAYPSFHSDTFDRLVREYLQERSNSISHSASDKDLFIRRQMLYPLVPMHHQQPQVQPTCLPHVWTCGPGLPPCCAGLMCYDGNAKRGRHCVARG